MLIFVFPKKLFEECPVGYSDSLYRTPCLFSLYGQFCQTLLIVIVFEVNAATYRDAISRKVQMRK